MLMGKCLGSRLSPNLGNQGRLPGGGDGSARIWKRKRRWPGGGRAVLPERVQRAEPGGATRREQAGGGLVMGSDEAGVG